MNEDVSFGERKRRGGEKRHCLTDLKQFVSFDALGFEGHNVGNKMNIQSILWLNAEGKKLGITFLHHIYSILKAQSQSVQGDG